MATSQNLNPEFIKIIQDIRQKYESMNLHPELYHNEYKTLKDNGPCGDNYMKEHKTNWNSQFASCLHMDNYNRNRYSDVPCLESSRVKIHLRKKEELDKRSSPQEGSGVAGLNNGDNQNKVPRLSSTGADQDENNTSDEAKSAKNRKGGVNSKEAATVFMGLGQAIKTGVSNFMNPGARSRGNRSSAQWFKTSKKHDRIEFSI